MSNDTENQDNSHPLRASNQAYYNNQQTPDSTPMPKPSKRVAARQAALSKKKKKGPPKSSVLLRGQNPVGSTEKVQVREPASASPRAYGTTDSDLPEFGLPTSSEDLAKQDPSRSARGTERIHSRRDNLSMPYIVNDLKIVGVLGSVMLGTLIVLALIVG